jgi:hypothetical protein
VHADRACDARSGEACVVMAPLTAAATIPLVVIVNGSGSVRVGTQLVSCSHATCRRTLGVSVTGSIKIVAQPAQGWKLTRWAGCAAAAGTCTLRPVRATRVVVTFAAPGSSANPVPLGVDAPAGGWRLKVISSAFLQPPATQYPCMAVLVSATAPAGGGYRLDQFIEAVFVKPIGSNPGGAASTGPRVCGGSLPSPDLWTQGKIGPFGFLFVDGGATVTGYLYFNISAEVADSPVLFVEPSLEFQTPNTPDTSVPHADAIYFALK